MDSMSVTREQLDALAQLAHSRAADEYIRELTKFIWGLSYERDTTVTLADFKEQAREMICMVEGCMNRPGNHTPDGRGFCGEHAQLMD